MVSGDAHTCTHNSYLCYLSVASLNGVLFVLSDLYISSADYGNHTHTPQVITEIITFIVV